MGITNNPWFTTGGGGEVTISRDSLDAAGRLQVSEPTIYFDGLQHRDNLPLLYDRENGGGATQVHTAADSETVMSVTAEFKPSRSWRCWVVREVA